MDQKVVFRKKTMDELHRVSVAEMQAAAHFPMWILLDNIRSMHNVGSVFRTADAFNISGIALSGFTPRPPHRDIHKTALGATESVAWRYHADSAELVAEFKAAGYTIVAVEQTTGSMLLPQHGGVSCHDKLLLVFGNEVSGVSDEVLRLCDGVIEIPQWGSKHSLNISVSVGVVLWELVRSAAGDLDLLTNA